MRGAFPGLPLAACSFAAFLRAANSERRAAINARFTIFLPNYTFTSLRNDHQAGLVYTEEIFNDVCFLHGFVYRDRYCSRQQ
jgi:hypothetical protein